MNRSLLIVAVVVSLLPHAVVSADDNLSTQLMQCSFKITDGHTNGTGFVLDASKEDSPSRWVLVTAAHVFEQIKEDEATLIVRKPAPNDSYTKHNHRFRIRRDENRLWAKHPTQDVAAIQLSLPADVPLPRLPVECLATDELLKRYEVQPGDIVRCVGFPHAGQFEPNAAGLPLVRIGCIASYPLLPTKQTRTFLYDFNTFEGDSGAAVYLDDARRILSGNAEGERVRLILGVIHGQHFIDEKFKTIYQSGLTRHRMGLSIVVHATAIRETLDRLEATGD